MPKFSLLLLLLDVSQIRDRLSHTHTHSFSSFIIVWEGTKEERKERFVAFCARRSLCPTDRDE